MTVQRFGLGSTIAGVMSVLAAVAALWTAAYCPCSTQASGATEPAGQETEVDPIAPLPLRISDGQIAASRYDKSPGFPAHPITVLVSELYDLPPGRHAIPALDDPPGVGASQVEWLEGDGGVLGVQL